MCERDRGQGRMGEREQSSVFVCQSTETQVVDGIYGPVFSSYGYLNTSACRIRCLRVCAFFPGCVSKLIAVAITAQSTRIAHKIHEPILEMRV